MFMSHSKQQLNSAQGHISCLC